MNTSPYPSPRLSLVEILIAVTLGSLLVSILIPALKQSSADAALAKCRSNLHQVGAAISLYAAENDGMLPPNLNSTFYANIRISETQARGVGNLVGAPIGYGNNLGYLQSWSPLFCPSQQSYPFPQPGERSNVIGYMGVYIGSDAGGWWHINNWTNSTTSSNPLMPVLFDFGQAGSWPAGSVVTRPAHPTSDPAKPDARTGFINVLHVGGHVSTRSLEDADNHVPLGTLMRYFGTGIVNPNL